tara:strand:+ start:105 stop:404 length:300 start_codon:yes stop_codon:yes gene_type:complete
MKRRNIINKEMLKKNKRRPTRINKKKPTPYQKNLLPDFDETVLHKIQEESLVVQKYPTIGCQMNHYMERAERSDPGYIRVEMDELFVFLLYPQNHNLIY